MLSFVSLFFKFIYLFWERERGVGQREGQTEAQAASVLSAQSLIWGSNSRTVRSWSEWRSRVRCSTDWVIQTPLGMLSLVCLCGGIWVAQLVKRPTSAQVVMSQFVGSSPVLGSVLTALSLKPASDSVSPSLSAPPSLACTLSLFQKWINVKKNLICLCDDWQMITSSQLILSLEFKGQTKFNDVNVSPTYFVSF